METPSQLTIGQMLPSVRCSRTQTDQTITKRAFFSMGGSAGRCISLLVALVVLTTACSSQGGDGDAGKEPKSTISATTDQAVSMIQTEAEKLGRTKLEKPLDGPVGAYVDGVLQAAELFRAAAKDLDREDANTLTYVGMGLTLSRLVQAAAGPAPTSGDDSQRLDELLAAAEQEKVGSFDDRELSSETGNLLRPMAYAGLFGSPEVVKQLLPPGSKEAERFATWVRYDAASSPIASIPLPNLGNEGGDDPSSWNKFVQKISEEEQASQGGALEEALEIINEKIERSS